MSNYTPKSKELDYMLNFSIKLLLFLSLLLSLVFPAGCLKKPYYPGKDYGRLHILLVLAEESGIMRAGAEDLKEIVLRLLYEGGRMTREEVIPFTAGQPMEASFSSLYPGKWEITAEAFDHENTVVLSSAREVNIEPGSNNTVKLHLSAAPGFLELTLDASEIPGFGTEITAGRLYVYLNPEANTSTGFDLLPEGIFLTTRASLPAGTFQIRVAVPHINKPVYRSPYYTVHIRSGRVTYLTIIPEEELIVTGIIDFPPKTPAGLTLYRENSLVHLSWEEVVVPDLAGYRLYRTDKEGRFRFLTELPAGRQSHTDEVTDDYFAGRIGYAVSSFDTGGNESLWSEPAYLEAGD